MTISQRAQAVLLLTAHFGKPDKDRPKPLSVSEWDRLASWLKSQDLVSETLIREDPESVLTGWSDPSITVERVCYLLGRGGTLALVAEKWERVGLWVVTRSEPGYPKRLKQLLKGEPNAREGVASPAMGSSREGWALPRRWASKLSFQPALV